MIEGVDPAPNAGEDKGATPRVQPCLKRTWCFLEEGHDGPCHEVPRGKLPPSDFGPRRSRR